MMPPGTWGSRKFSSCPIAASFDTLENARAACAITEEGNEGKVSALALLAQLRVPLESIDEISITRAVERRGRKSRGDIITFERNNEWYVATFRDFRSLVAALVDIKRRLKVPRVIEVERHGVRESVEWYFGPLDLSLVKCIRDVKSETQVLWLPLFDDGLSKAWPMNDAGRHEPTRKGMRRRQRDQHKLFWDPVPARKSDPPSPLLTNSSPALLNGLDCVLMLTTSRLDPPAELFTLLFATSPVTPAVLCIYSITSLSRDWYASFDSPESTRAFRQHIAKATSASLLRVTVPGPDETRLMTSHPGIAITILTLIARGHEQVQRR
ncbi:hypothetical protein HK104_001686 [Borealophlyctis nickersoniae]|nr:hypothetical protein HK104_001686 [Borealophlyctis nickersoniae]